MKLLNLFEALPLHTGKLYSRKWNKERYSNVFGKDYRIYLPYTMHPDNRIIDYLTKNGWIIKDYVAGLIEKPGDKRIFKIGRILPPELLQIYANDPIRQAKNANTNDLLICISRHPYDIAGMSTNRKWSSCIKKKIP